jgi:hypothetical protein
MSTDDWITYCIPTDESLLAAVGRVAIAHAHLDNVLRMTIRSILGMSVNEALDETFRVGSAKLRERIRHEVRSKLRDKERRRLDAILKRAEEATEKRNVILHGLWTEPVGTAEKYIRRDDKTFGPQPTVDDLKSLLDEVCAVTKELDEDRHGGLVSREPAPDEVLPKTRKRGKDGE